MQERPDQRPGEPEQRPGQRPGQNEAPDSAAGPFERDLESRSVELDGNPAYEEFLDDIQRRGHMDHEFARRAATSVLCSLEQSLRAGRAKAPDDTLPPRLQHLMTACERPGETPPLAFNPEELIYTVADDLQIGDGDARRIIIDVFAATRRQLSQHDQRLVARKLPVAVQNLWFAHSDT